MQDEAKTVTIVIAMPCSDEKMYRSVPFLKLHVSISKAVINENWLEITVFHIYLPTHLSISWLAFNSLDHAISQDDVFSDVLWQASATWVCMSIPTVELTNRFLSECKCLDI